MTDAKKVTDKLVKTKLADYNTQPAPKPVSKPVAKPVTRSIWDDQGDMFASRGRQPSTRQTTVNSPKPYTSAKDYKARYPAAQTPSVLSKAKVDQRLKAMQELPWPRETAVYSRLDFERLVSVLADYMLDVTEGAGLINSGTAGTALRDALAKIIPDHFKHCDPFDGEYRVISVEQDKK